jgi:hypothetical protein
MPHSGYPCSEQAHKSSFHTPETKQQERDNKRRRHYGGSVHDQVAWIPREKAHQEGDEIIDSSCIRSCQKAKPTADGDPAHDKTGDEADEKAESEHEEFQQRQDKCRFDGQPIHCDLQAGDTERSCIDENKQYGEQGREYTCNGSGNVSNSRWCIMEIAPSICLTLILVAGYMRRPRVPPETARSRARRRQAPIKAITILPIKP